MAEPPAEAHAEEEAPPAEGEDQGQPEDATPHADVGMEEPEAEEAEQIGEEQAPAVPETTVEESIHTPEKSPMEKIMEALRGGLAELQTAALSRDEVHRVEDMFMDIKRELYAAEFRGRK